MDINISSKSLGGVKLKGKFVKVENERGCVLISHNASGMYDSELYRLIEKVCNENSLSTLRYNLHYVDNIPVEKAKWEDIEHDISAAYEELSKRSSSPKYLMGKSLGSAASLYIASNQTDIAALGLFAIPLGMIKKYVRLDALKNIETPVHIWHGTDDRFGTPEDIKAFLSPYFSNLKVTPMEKREHSFERQNTEEENVKLIQEVIQEMTK